MIFENVRTLTLRSYRIQCIPWANSVAAGKKTGTVWTKGYVFIGMKNRLLGVSWVYSLLVNSKYKTGN